MDNQQLLTIFMTIFMTILFLPTTSTWAHTGIQHDLTLEITLTLPGNHLDPSWKSPWPSWKSPWPSWKSPWPSWKTLPPHESFINRIYQQDIPTNSRRPTCCQPNSPTSPITMSSEQTIWTHLNRLNPSEQTRLNHTKD